MCIQTASVGPLPCKCSRLEHEHEHEEHPYYYYNNMFDPFIPKTHKLIDFSLSLAVREAKSILQIAFPMILTGLLLYSRSMISMLFLGRLGDLALAGGSLALGFANITGYSILSGLAMGMEPICVQAFGANKFSLLAISLQRTVLLLLFTSIPIAFLWFNIKTILLFFGQNESIAIEAQSYLLFSFPDLFAQSLLHPLRIYLRSQSITLPLTFCASMATILHLPINYLLVFHLGMGTRGVAVSSVLFNFNMVGFLILYLIISGVYEKTWTGGLSMQCFNFKEWKSLLCFSLPSCISVCLEWWWYEIMILLCGLLSNPEVTVASMGILIQTTSLIYIFPSSLSFSVSTRVGNELGAGEPVKARRAANVGICCSIVMGLVALFFTTMVRGVWARMFTSDGEIVALTAMVLPIIGICELGNCPQTTGCGVLRGTARPAVGANINLGCFYGVGMPVAVGLGFFLGFEFEGLWLGLLAAELSCAVVMLLVLWRTDWELEMGRARELIGERSGEIHDEKVDYKESTRIEEEEEEGYVKEYSSSCSDLV
ncbi:protein DETOXIFICATION 49-like [Impatiens glandulifera]|uniref:protein DETOXIFICATION 49-like n=1 Tax=Impatiens glandulifera TaxID=253017 RepID=UPI001FB15A97|nr:protein DETOXIFICATION 49-like [Impatiens glandulifera]